MTRALLPRMTMMMTTTVLITTAAARGEAESSTTAPRVDSVVTATSDVHHIVTVGDRTLVATSGGLVVRRAGSVVQTLTAMDGLPGARLRALGVVPGGVWVAAIEGVALVTWQGEAVQISRTLPLRRVRAVARHVGETWFATYGSGLYRLADQDGAAPRQVRVGPHVTHDHQTSLAAAGEELLVGTAGAGIFRIGADGRTVGRLRAARGLADDLVWDLLRDGDRVIASTAAGVSVIRGGAVVAGARESQIASSLPVRDVRAAARVGDALFVGTYGGGLYRIPSRGDAPIRVGSAAGMQRIQALAPAGARVLVGHSAGLDQVDESGTAHRRLARSGLPSGDVTAMARAFGALWVGTFSDGLARVAPSGAVELSRARTRWGMDRRINHLAVTSPGTPAERLWIATDRGLYWHDGRRFVRVEAAQAPSTEEHVTCLHVPRANPGRLWVASSRQLSARGADGSWRSWSGAPRLPMVNLHAVTTDLAGQVWVGSLHGLFRFDESAGSFERHSVSSGALPVDWVTALVPWGPGGVVAGTYHGGLSWFDGAAFRIEAEGDAPGLPSGWVNPHAMARVGELLWVGTLERGLAVRDNAGAWHHLTTAQGLPSDDVTDIIADGPGRALVATRGGLARVSF